VYIYCVTSVDFLHVSSTPSKRDFSSDDKAIVLDSDDDNGGEDTCTPTKHKASPSKVRNITERNSYGDISSRSKMSGKRDSRSNSRIGFESNNEDLLSPFEDAKTHRSIKRQVLSII
jgi:hypothetical protein